MTLVEKAFLLAGARKFVVDYNSHATDVQRDLLSRVVLRTIDSTDGDDNQMLYVACQLLRMALRDTEGPSFT